MTKKKNDKDTEFDLQSALTDLPYPDFVKRAFNKTVDLSKVKSKSDLDKEFKKYMELKL